MRNDQSDPFLAVLRDLLSFATTDRIPAVVVFDNGLFNPYGLPPRERTGDRGETERRAEHVEEQNTLVQDLSQSRQDLKVIEASHLSFEALADRVSRSGVADVFIFVPVEGCLLRDLAKVEDDELSDREVAVTQADRRYLESIGLHHIDQLSGGIGLNRPGIAGDSNP